MADEPIIQGPVIQYEVKDILADMRREQATGFSELKESLSTKADKSDLAEFRGELRGHAIRIDHLEAADRERTSASAATSAANAAVVAGDKAREDKRTRRTTFLLGAISTIGVVLAVVLPLTLR